MRPFWMQLRDMVQGRMGATVFVSFMGILSLLMPILADIFFIFWFAFFSFKTLPFKMPMFTHRLDKNDTPPGSRKPNKAAGIYFFGNDIDNQQQLWFSNTDMRTHALIFGSTGSGKTESLVSLAYNALVQGSGFIYVDGKGDN